MKNGLHRAAELILLASVYAGFFFVRGAHIVTFLHSTMDGSAVERDKFGRKAEKAGSIMKSLARLGVYTPRRDISTHLTDVSFWSIGLVFLFAFASLVPS